MHHVCPRVIGWYNYRQVMETTAFLFLYSWLCLSRDRCKNADGYTKSLCTVAPQGPAKRQGTQARTLEVSSARHRYSALLGGNERRKLCDRAKDTSMTNISWSHHMSHGSRVSICDTIHSKPFKTTAPSGRG